jgi:hypothetical protein
MFSIFGIEIHIWIGSAHRESLRKVSWRTRKNFEYEIDREGRNRYCNTYFVSPLLKNNENFNLLPYVEWDRFVTLTEAQAE